jgi:Flp pilus assembly pilin Flp
MWQYAPHQKGQGLVEYAFILALIALLVVVGVSFFGQSLISYYFQEIVDLFIAATS